MAKTVTTRATRSRATAGNQPPPPQPPPNAQPAAINVTATVEDANDEEDGQDGGAQVANPSATTTSTHRSSTSSLTSVDSDGRTERPEQHAESVAQTPGSASRVDRNSRAGELNSRNLSTEVNRSASAQAERIRDRIASLEAKIEWSERERKAALAQKAYLESEVRRAQGDANSYSRETTREQDSSRRVTSTRENASSREQSSQALPYPGDDDALTYAEDSSTHPEVDHIDEARERLFRERSESETTVEYNRRLAAQGRFTAQQRYEEGRERRNANALNSWREAAEREQRVRTRRGQAQDGRRANGGDPPPHRGHGGPPSDDDDDDTPPSEDRGHGAADDVGIL